MNVLQNFNQNCDYIFFFLFLDIFWLDIEFLNRFADGSIPILLPLFLFIFL